MQFKTVSSLLLVFSVGATASFLLFRTSTPVISETNIKAGNSLARNGRDVIPACNSCHGLNGQGDFKKGIPRLAGLDIGYIEKQLEDFTRDPLRTRSALKPITRDYTKTPRSYGDLTVFTPGTREDKTMNKLAKQLTKKDRSDLAIYFSQLSFESEPVAHDFETLERGEDLAVRGKPEFGLPACISCHGSKGEGYGALFPPLAGQPTGYIKKQISDWQSGKRDNDNLALMRNIADQLTDGDMENIAAYYSNLSYSVNLD